jgi:hypothetical protein
MGIGVLFDRDTGYQVLYCTTSMRAFGPVFYDSDGEDPDDFLVWLDENYRVWRLDPRELDRTGRLDGYVQEWRDHLAEQAFDAAQEGPLWGQHDGTFAEND